MFLGFCVGVCCAILIAGHKLRLPQIKVLFILRMLRFVCFLYYKNNQIGTKGIVDFAHNLKLAVQIWRVTSNIL